MTTLFRIAFGTTSKNRFCIYGREFRPLLCLSCGLVIRLVQLASSLSSDWVALLHEAHPIINGLDDKNVCSLGNFHLHRLEIGDVVTNCMVECVNVCHMCPRSVFNVEIMFFDDLWFDRFVVS